MKTLTQTLYQVPTLVEVEPEAAIRRIRSGLVRWVWVEGDDGVGKSTLCHILQHSIRSSVVLKEGAYAFLHTNDTPEEDWYRVLQLERIGVWAEAQSQLAVGVSVIQDRSPISKWAYQEAPLYEEDQLLRLCHHHPNVCVVLYTNAENPQSLRYRQAVKYGGFWFPHSGVLLPIIGYECNPSDPNSLVRIANGLLRLLGVSYEPPKTGNTDS